MPVLTLCVALLAEFGVASRPWVVRCASVAQKGISCLVAGFVLVAWWLVAEDTTK